jgi:hypothetical protein
VGVNRADFATGRLPKGTLVFENGESSKEVTILLAADSHPENDEAFAVVLRKPSANARIILRRIDVALINDDDPSSNTPANAAGLPDLFEREPEELRDVIPPPTAPSKAVDDIGTFYLDAAWLKKHWDWFAWPL